MQSVKWGLYGPEIMPRWVSIGLMLFALMYSAMKLALFDQFRILEALLIPFALYAFFIYGSKLRLSFPALMMYASVFVTLASWLFMQISHPEIARSSPKIVDLLDKFPFVLLAFAIASSKQNVNIFLMVAALATLLLPWTLGNGLNDIVSALEGRRIGFGRNPIRVSATYALVLIGMLVFFRRLVIPGAFSWWRFSLWVLLFFVFMFLFLAGRSRGPMLAFGFVSFGLVIYLLYSSRRIMFSIFRRSKAFFIVVFVFLFLFMAAALALYKSVATDMVKKTAHESIAVSAFLDGRYHDIPDTSVGYRLQFIVAGFKWGSERPFFGWGYRGGQVAIDKEEIAFDYDHYSYNQLHNGYMELWLRYGLLGVLLFFSLMVWMIRMASIKASRGEMGVDYFVFFLGFLVFYAIVNLFDSFLFIRDGIYMFDVVMAAIFSFFVKDFAFSSSVETDSHEGC